MDGMPPVSRTNLSKFGRLTSSTFNSPFNVYVNKVPAHVHPQHAIAQRFSITVDRDGALAWVELQIATTDLAAFEFRENSRLPVLRKPATILQEIAPFRHPE
jgi:hypothetical protein